MEELVKSNRRGRKPGSRNNRTADIIGEQASFTPEVSQIEGAAFLSDKPARTRKPRKTANEVTASDLKKTEISLAGKIELGTVLLAGFVDKDYLAMKRTEADEVAKHAQAMILASPLAKLYIRLMGADAGAIGLAGAVGAYLLRVVIDAGTQNDLPPMLAKFFNIILMKDGDTLNVTQASIDQIH